MSTTIEVEDGQKDVLDDLKYGNEPYKDVLQRLIENYDEDGRLTEDRVREIVREEVRDSVVREALQ